MVLCVFLLRTFAVFVRSGDLSVSPVLSCAVCLAAHRVVEPAEHVRDRHKLCITNTSWSDRPWAHGRRMGGAWEALEEHMGYMWTAHADRNDHSGFIARRDTESAFSPLLYVAVEAPTIGHTRALADSP